MASLSTVVNALISQIGQGRSQADMALLEVAKMYKADPLLAEFPIPRLSLDEVVIDLKVSIAASPAPKGTITPKTKKEIVSQIKAFVEKIPDQELLRELFQQHDGLQNRWVSQRQELDNQITQLIPDDTIIEPKILAASLSTAISKHLGNVAIDASKITLAQLRNIHNQYRMIEGDVTNQMEQIITKAIQSQPTTTDQIEVLVTAAELENIPPEKITTMRLTLQESDRAWTQIETEDGVKDKLSV